MNKKKVWILLLVLGFLLALLVGKQSWRSSPTTTEILWDTYGIPHIYGKDTASSFRAFGWAQMQSHGDLLLRLYGQARGRAAEYWGEDYLESDRWVRTMGVPDRAQSWYDRQNPDFRNYLDAFAAGINAYATAHPEAIEDEVEAVLPVNGVDVLAHFQRVLNFTFVVDPGRVAGVTESTVVSASGNYEDFLTSAKGSNGWAIAPSRSESGNAMLLANPHLPWSDLFLWYEAQITAPGMDAYGATLVGVPVLAIAFNDRLGWTHTVNTHDGWDAYKLKLEEGGYRFDGAVRPFQTQRQILKVKQDDGTLREEELVVRQSIHGPVVAETDEGAIALRVVGLDSSGGLKQWWEMARARNLSEFETALQPLQLPMFTVMYADRDGHILHLFNGRVPVREQGNFDDWWGLIPGDTSTTLWTNIHPYEDLPRVVDPPSGWLHNTNDPPWTTTFPLALNPDDFPAYMAPRVPIYMRAQRSVRMLTEDERISFAEMVEYKHSTRMELADRVLDDLISAARRQESAIARQAADILERWDRKADADSRGAVLFATWEREIDYSTLFVTAWSAKSPYTTPKGLADPASAVAALEAAAKKVQTAYGALDVPWGDVFRLRLGNVDLPANGGPGSLGIFRMLDFFPTEDGRFQAFNGDSFVAAIEFSRPVRAMALTSYGNATQPGSASTGDQLKLFASKQLRPVWRDRQDIEANLVARQVF